MAEPPTDCTEDQDQETANPEKSVLQSKKLQKLRKAYETKGIIYVSRIPPHMKPHKLRQLLEQFGSIGRLYCAPEDPALRKQRKQKGGNTGKNFTEGWVEFEDKAVAKQVATMLNNNPIGGKRRSAYHYDLWSLKYLPKFKWDHLTEEIAYQNAIREQKLAAEISAAKRERDFYMGQVDKAKGIEAMKERKRKREDAGEGEPAGGQAEPAALRREPLPTDNAPAKAESGSKHKRVLRTYGQKKAKADSSADDATATLTPDFLALVGGQR
ncbi:hypothetical protein ABBQ32_009391 [Trebouxia sp. C0010 RCD-2024]